MSGEAPLSKSAKQRAAKKARDEATAAAEAPAPAAAPAKAEPKAKAKAEAKPAAAEPKAKAKAKAEPAPKAEAKAAAKGKAKAAAAPAPAPEPAPKAAAKGKAKAEPKPAAAKAKGKAKAQPSPKMAPAEAPAEPWAQIDDGTGGDWEVSAGVSKKQQKKKEQPKEEKTEAPKTAGYPSVYKQQTAAPADGKGKGKGPRQDFSQHASVLAAQAKVDAALKMLDQIDVKSVTAPAPSDPSLHSASVVVPEKKIGAVIGPKGATIKAIQEKTGVSRVDTTGEVFTITGEEAAVKKAEAAIKEIIEKGYCTMFFEDFADDGVMVHPSAFPDLIGKGGCVIRKIKEELGVEVGIPQVPKDQPQATKKTYKVTVAGEKANVEKAKAVIEDIVMYYHSEVTHPDEVHEELVVEDWALRFVIGKGGSEMRHIQNNFKVRVYVPREHSKNQNVVLVGNKEGVDRSKVYIDKIIANASEAAKGREKEEKTEDHWGEDKEPEEDWMKAYIVRR